MKILIKSLFGFLALCLFFASCKKEELKDIQSNNKPKIESIGVINAFTTKSSLGDKAVELSPLDQTSGRFYPVIELLSQNNNFYEFRVRSNFPGYPISCEWGFSSHGGMLYDLGIIKTGKDTISIDVRIPAPITGPLHVDIRMKGYDGKLYGGDGTCVFYQAKSDGSVPIYQYMNNIKCDHFYTPNYALTQGGGDWKYEDAAFYGFREPKNGSVPIYQYMNNKITDHYYSLGYAPTIGDWIYEYIAFYAYKTQVSGSVPIYSYWNSISGDHYYSPTNGATAGGGNWKNEGIAFYALPK